MHGEEGKEIKCREEYEGRGRGRKDAVYYLIHKSSLPFPTAS